MAEYIEREKVYERLNALGGCDAEHESWADGWDKAIDTAIYELNEISAADVRPERHSEWVEKNGIFECRKCGYAFEHEGYKHYFNFCPCCGAKMDGKDGSDDEKSI